MRQFATGLNRTWLGIIGLLLLAAGLAATAIGTGLWHTVLSGGPDTGDDLVGSWAGDSFAHTAVIAGVGLIALLAALVGLRWLLAQVPRKNAAAVFRLQDDTTTGLTTCSPSVLTDAVSVDVQTLPGVTAAEAVLRGTADKPELTVKVTANDRTDIPALIRGLESGPVAHLATAMGATMEHLAVQVDISPQQRTADSITL